MSIECCADYNAIISEVAEHFPCLETDVSFKIKPNIDLNLYLSEVCVVVRKGEKIFKVVGYVNEMDVRRFRDTTKIWLCKLKGMCIEIERRLDTC